MEGIVCFDCFTCPSAMVTHSGVILGQNCVRLSDATLDDIFFFKNLFDQKQCRYAMNIEVGKIRGALL